MILIKLLFFYLALPDLCDMDAEFIGIGLKEKKYKESHNKLENSGNENTPLPAKSIDIDGDTAYFETDNIAYIWVATPYAHELSPLVRTDPVAHDSNESRPGHTLEDSIEDLENVDSFDVEVGETDHADHSQT